jgi:hypothetical protein
MTANGHAPHQEQPKAEVEGHDGKASAVPAAASRAGVNEAPDAPEVEDHDGKASVVPAAAARAVVEPPKARSATEPAPGKPNPSEPKPAGQAHPLWRRARNVSIALVVVAASATTLWLTALRPPLVSVAEVKLGVIRDD